MVSDEEKLKEEHEPIETKVFMFIPDLTGYTKYMSATDSKRSHLVIEKLLKSLVDADQLDLQISDILGDAIFFYKEGTPPKFEDLLQQCKRMINVLESTLRAALVELGFWRNAALKAQSISIKFVAHYGQARVTEIGGHSQLIGKACIEVHSLLKNSVALDNYLLATKECIKACNTEEEYKALGTEGSDLYRHLGVIKYRAFDLNIIPHNELGDSGEEPDEKKTEDA